MVNSPGVRMESVARRRVPASVSDFVFCCRSQVTPLLKALDCGLAAARLFALAQWPKDTSLPLPWYYLIDRVETQLWPGHVPPSSRHRPGCRSHRLITTPHSIVLFFFRIPSDQLDFHNFALRCATVIAESIFFQIRYTIWFVILSINKKLKITRHRLIYLLPKMTNS